MASGHVRARKNAAGKITSWAFVLEAEREPGQKRQTKWQSGFRTRKDAERALRERLTDLQRGVFQEPTRLLVSDLFTRWLAYKMPRVRAATYVNYEGVIRVHLNPAFGARPLAKLGAEEIDAYFSRAMVEQGGSTREKNWVVLKMVLSQAVRWDLIAGNPCLKATAPTRKDDPPSRGRAFTDEERKTALSGMEGWVWSAAMVAAGGAMRRGEILALKWADIDWEQGIIQVERAVVWLAPLMRATPDSPIVQIGPPKSKSSLGPVEIGEPVLRALRVQQQNMDALSLEEGENFQEEGWVFPRKDGSLRNPNSLTRAWRSAALALGLPTRFHDLRHDHATVLLEAGVSILEVSQRLRHSDPAITSRVYAHVTARMRERSLEIGNSKLNEALEGRKEGSGEQTESTAADDASS